MSDLVNEQKLRKASNIHEPSSEEEFEDLRKYKMSEMYRKVGYVRNYMLISLGIISISGYLYIQKNKRKSVLGTELHQMVINKIKFNDKIKLKFGDNIKFP